jgi:trans-aconitate methyltransferase
MTSLKKSWDNRKVFEKQLDFNLIELSSKNKYPPHWNDFISLVRNNKPETILDVGCGCGAMYEVCRREFPNIGYFGLDFSKEAILLAKNTWSPSNFAVLDYKELTNEYVKDYDLVHLGALLDVLPDGDEALEHILSLNAKNILIGRMKLTERPSYYDEYVAYDEIKTCAFYHNSDNFYKLCNDNQYLVTTINNNYYLNKK